MTEIIILAALAKNNVIGKDGKIPWHISEDFKHFKEKTTGCPIIMGRKTWESLPIQPLPNRENIVITRNQDYTLENAIVKHSLEEAIDYCSNNEKTFIIGGASIYKIGLEIADTLELTFIDKEYEGDTFFPEVNYDEWELMKKEQHEGYSFNTFIRKNNKI